MPTNARFLNPDERLDWLRLTRTRGVGPITFYHLLGRFGSASAALRALPGLAVSGGRKDPMTIPSRAEAEREWEAVTKLGGRLIAWGEPDYPPPLAAVEDAPPLLTVVGAAETLRRPMIAVVGARNASANGRRFASVIAADLGQNGFVVVSGMARGIDAAAHHGSLPTGTVAAVAGGVDVVYPEENRELHRTVGERGAIVAEQPVGTVPAARHFPRRNRIVSGLSLGVVVIEAALRSGSLITARLAVEQGREVFAVPGSPLDPRCRGTNDLIRQGATLTETVDDVLQALGGFLGAAERRPPTPRGLPVEPEPVGDGELDAARTKLLELLGPSPVPVDELVRQCHLSTAVVMAVLLELELAGRIDRHPGQLVSSA